MAVRRVLAWTAAGLAALLVLVALAGAWLARASLPQLAGEIAAPGLAQPAKVVRDAHAERLFPDDDYDLSPGAFADVDPALHEPGLVWGAAKAHVIMARRRAEGRR